MSGFQEIKPEDFQAGKITLDTGENCIAPTFVVSFSDDEPRKVTIVHLNTMKSKGGLAPDLESTVKLIAEIIARRLDDPEIQPKDLCPTKSQ